ncbi:MAG TPA: FKBP-type peptidyl-prolyl cis-trans isomerase [Polyangia bacterium]|nr:FKBP-type peptidyl-prolyl cis-trans isomerase [Polyangia bacterium]
MRPRRRPLWPLVLATAAVLTVEVGGRLAAQPIEPLPPAPPPAAPPAPPDVAAPPADAKKTASGLASKVLVKGTGTAHPGPHDRVTVEYTGWTPDGKTFDSSLPGGEPARLSLDAVIKGWTEGLQLMVTGEKRRLWIPAALAYGNKPARSGAPAGPLVFDVALLAFVKVTPPPPAPPDVAEVPADAKRTSTGLGYKFLKHGTGKSRPTADDTVVVHYSGWTTEGDLFDSSVVRGQPATFPLSGVIKGWTEGLQLMVVGDKARFWIPARLAYGDHPHPGEPAGMLVFDVELLAIK